MKDFIVWDKIAKEFADNICLDAELLQDGISYSLEVKEELFELFYPIGLKDINGKSIYANSSIVEWCHPQGNIYNGYFKWNQKELCYEVITIDSNDNYNGIKLKFFYLQMNNLKIIDTIQENKLGLIK